MPPSSTAARDRYHHGDLKRALIAAALDVVEREGHEAVTLRSLAKAAHVAPSAPYRHFADRDALLAAVAAEGFELAMSELERAIAGRSAREVIRPGAEALLTFAEQRPMLFRLMFRSDLLVREGGPPEALRAAAGGASERFERAIGRVLSDASDDEIKVATTAIWSAVFGFAVLSSEGRIKPFMRGGLTPQAFRARVLDVIGAMLGPS